MKTNKAKLFAVIFFAVPVLFVTIFRAEPAKGAAAAEEPSVTYKAKCAMCHTPKADKFFDASKSEDEHVQTIMKGKKTEKPPFMPGFEAKGMTEDEAKALTAFMKSLREPAN
jgi:mono/diheme cytochrome c family protein